MGKCRAGLLSLFTIVGIALLLASAPQASAQTTLSIIRNVEGDPVYAPGGTVDLTITFIKDGPDMMSQLGLSEWTPEGWTFNSIVAGEAPHITPSSGDTGKIDFAYLFPPMIFPVSFTYRLNVPSVA